MWVSENKVLRKTVGHMRGKVTEDWRKLRKEKIHALYATPYYKGDEINEDEMGEACGMYGG